MSTALESYINRRNCRHRDVRRQDDRGHVEGLRSDHQPDPGRESRARVQLQSGRGAGGAGPLHRQRRQRRCDRGDRRGDRLHTGFREHQSRAAQLCRPLTPPRPLVSMATVRPCVFSGPSGFD